MSGARGELPGWLVLGVAVIVACLAASALGLPSPWLFGALLVALAWALTRSDGRRVPRPVFVASQAILGVALGADLQVSTLKEVAHHWAPVAFVCLATLAISLGAGLLLARIAPVDPATASLGLVAGGASGIVAMSEDLGADDRLVAFMQYFRVLVVVLLAPIVVKLAGGHTGGAAASDVAGTLPEQLLFTVGMAAAGLALARVIPIDAGTLLVPLILAGVLTGSGALHIGVPAAIQDATFVVIGTQVGLRFTRDSIGAAWRLLPGVSVSIGLLIAACAGLAALLGPLAHVPFLDAYLATTPGGLFAVAAAAFGSGVDTTFVLAVQSLRLFAMILAAPALVKLLHRRRLAR